MLSDNEFRQMKVAAEEALHLARLAEGKMEEALDRLERLDDVVRGNEPQGIKGLVPRMTLFEEFVNKWDKREYLVRSLYGLFTAQIILTIIAIIAQIWV